MPTETRIVREGPRPRTVITERGQVLTVPDGWALLAPGDAGLTRRVKAGGPTWTAQERVGRRTFSRGVWAPEERIARARAEIATERADPAYARRLAADRDRRADKQEAYVEDFRGAVLAFLAFDPAHAALEAMLADAVTRHATPVGSGTVARTARIPVEERAEAAVIAWMRHQTTGYDDMRIERVAGRRREVRRELAQLSRAVLDVHRRDVPHAPAACSLCAAAAAPPRAPELEGDAALDAIEL
jgi:hypothetical protein